LNVRGSPRTGDKMQANFRNWKPVVRVETCKVPPKYQKPPKDPEPDERELVVNDPVRGKVRIKFDPAILKE